MTTRPPTRLYLITPPQFTLEAFARQFEEALEAGDVACVQLRMKAADGGAESPTRVLRAAETLLPIAHAAGVAFLLNDDPELADLAGADGVHVGQEDASIAAARDRLGANAIIGATCHDSRHLAMEAAEAGADYVAFGAFFPTDTKAAKTRADPELLTWWQEAMTPPCVAIGGITADNAGALARAGADFVAVSAGVWRHPDGPAAGVRAINAALTSASS